MKQKAKKSVDQQPIVEEITGMPPDLAEFLQKNERRSLQSKRIAIDEATAVLGIVASPPIHPDMLAALRAHLKASPLSPEGVAMVVFMAEDRGRSRRAREAGSSRHSNGIEHARKRWNERSDDERRLKKIAFARKISAEIAERFMTANESPLVIRPETVVTWFEST